MRRTIPEDIDTYTARPYERAEPKSLPLLDITLRLSCITPVIGGGVRKLEPDTVDVVRVPSVRGQLRYWWRALGPETSPQELFENESAIWGGVSGAEGKAIASRVRVTKSIVDKWLVEPAGYHRVDKDKNTNGGTGKSAKPRLRSMPDWSRDLGYGLFPFQLDSDELKNATVAKPTRSVRWNLSFDLRIRLDPARGGEPHRRNCEHDEVNRLLWTLWAWIHFGGIGGRTTRGFGALAVHAPLSGVPEAWKHRFKKPRSSNVKKWLIELWDSAAPPRLANSLGWAHLGGARVFVGEPVAQPALSDRISETAKATAHSNVIGALRRFRQERGFGRDVSTNGKPAGQSHWPEPHMLRAQTQMEVLREQKRSVDWEHQPPREIVDHVVSPTKTALTWTPPRAAFGLPIVVKFKPNDDRNASQSDTEADGTIALDAHGGRWMSPLRLRPIACSDGKHVPIALLFPLRPWTATKHEITFRGKVIYLKKDAPTLAGPMSRYMKSGQGDAAVAFTEWLKDKSNGYQEIGGGK